MAPPKRPALKRFMERVTVTECDCWEWTGACFSSGYGRFFADGKSHLAHRWAYQQLVGRVRKGKTLDHTCHNADPACDLGTRCPHRRCVNPAHLEPTTIKRNILRGKGHAAKNAKRRTCRDGHPLRGANLFVTSDGRRQCRTCMRARDRKTKANPAREEQLHAYAHSEKRKAYRRRRLEDPAVRAKERLHQREYARRKRAERA